MVNKGIQDLIDIAFIHEAARGNRSGGDDNTGCGYVILASPLLVEVFFYFIALYELCENFIATPLHRQANGVVELMRKNADKAEVISVAVVLFFLAAYVLIHFLALKNKKLMYVVLALTFLLWFVGLAFDGCLGPVCSGHNRIHFTATQLALVGPVVMLLIKKFEFWLFGKYNNA